MRRLLLFVLALALPGCVLPGAAAAQVAAGADLTVQSRYVWRGVRRSATPVVQPSAFFSWNPRGWTVTAGTWANVELGSAGMNDPTDAGRGRHWSETDYWAEAHTRRRGLDLRFGTIRYDFRGDTLGGGRDSDWDTGEVYGAAAALLGNLTVLGLTASYDYDVVDGTFITLEGTQHVPIAGIHGYMFSGLLRAVVGASYGQELSGDPSEPGYFDDAGVTHIDLSAATRVSSRTVLAYLAFHWQFNRDALTRQITLTRSSPRQSWLDAGISILIGSPARERR